MLRTIFMVLVLFSPAACSSSNASKGSHTNATGSQKCSVNSEVNTMLGKELDVNLGFIAGAHTLQIYNQVSGKIVMVKFFTQPEILPVTKKVYTVKSELVLIDDDTPSPEYGYGALTAEGISALNTLPVSGFARFDEIINEKHPLSDGILAQYGMESPSTKFQGAVSLAATNGQVLKLAFRCDLLGKPGTAGKVDLNDPEGPTGGDKSALNLDTFLGLKDGDNKAKVESIYGAPESTSQSGSSKFTKYFDNNLSFQFDSENYIVSIGVKSEIMNHSGYNFIKSKGYDTSAIELLAGKGNDLKTKLGEPDELSNSHYNYKLQPDNNKIQFFCVNDQQCSTLTLFWYGL